MLNRKVPKLRTIQPDEVVMVWCPENQRYETITGAQLLNKHGEWKVSHSMESPLALNLPACTC